MRATVAAMLSSCLSSRRRCRRRTLRPLFIRETHARVSKIPFSKAKNETKKNVSVIFVLENHAQSNI